MIDPGEERAAQVQALYALPLDEFTAARDDLARRLKREGDADAGAEVKRLRKPSVSAWAINQVRRKDPGASGELIEAGRRLREGQERLLAGEGREPLQRAAADERRLVGELAAQAERALAAAGRPAGGAVRERLRSTLHAAATDPEVSEALAAGRLVRDHEASGLGPFAGTPAVSGSAGVPASAEPGRQAPTKAAAALERKVRRLEEKLERARACERELAGQSAEAKRRRSEARREAERAAAALKRAEADEQRRSGRAAEAAEGVSELERELRELRDAGAD